jgi:hypothetical protein
MTRDGLPRLARRLRSGEPVRIVAFGSSVTLDGFYLDPIVPHLRAVFPGSDADVIRRALPGFMSFWAVHRTAAITELNADLVIVEFAINDHGLQVPEITLKSIEGIVRQLRSVPSPPDIAFVYFMSRLAEAVPRQAEVIELWERIADHYGITSIDCSAVAEDLVRSGKANWLERWPGRPAWDVKDHPFSLTRDLSHHTAEGGRILGRHVAEAIAEAALESRGVAEVSQALFPDNYADARSYFPSALEREGWNRRRVDDSAETQLTVMYFSELLVPSRIGASLNFEFTGREMKIWAHSAPGNVITLDGNRASLNLPDARMAFPTFILRESEPRTHKVEIDVHELPLEIGAIDTIGSLLF